MNALRNKSAGSLCHLLMILFTISKRIPDDFVCKFPPSQRLEITIIENYSLLIEYTHRDIMRHYDPLNMLRRSPTFVNIGYERKKNNKRCYARLPPLITSRLWISRAQWYSKNTKKKKMVLKALNQTCASAGPPVRESLKTCPPSRQDD